MSRAGQHSTVFVDERLLYLGEVGDAAQMLSNADKGLAAFLGPLLHGLPHPLPWTHGRS